jgi:hypothetical protein
VPFRGDGPRPAAPDATYAEGGAFAEGRLDGRIPLAGRGARLEGGASTTGVLGRRRSGAETTWYVRIADDVVAQLGLVLGAVGAESTREGVLEYTTRDGRPVRATVRSATGLAADVGVFGARTDLATLARRLRGTGASGTAGGRGGLQLDAAVSLDLGEPRNLAAVRDVLRLQDPVAAVRSVRRLGDRLDAAGDVDLAVFRTATRREDAGVQVGVGAGVGATYEHTVRTRDLLRAWAVTRGGPLREREDCGAA